MERLTQWIDENTASPRVDLRRCGHERCTTKLARYEDTGLTVEQIIELKERDTAKEPIEPETALEKYYHEPSCPNCEMELRTKICGYTLPQVIGEFHFCPWCGQKIKKRK